MQPDVTTLSRKHKGVVISLGRSCTPALLLEKCGLRAYSFPFDWNLTSFESLVKILENDFENFFDYKHFTIAEHGVKHIDYNIHFPHIDLHLDNWDLDENRTMFPKNEAGLHQYFQIKEKFCRRVARFYAFLHSGFPVYFLRHGQICVKEAEELYALLRRKFSACNFFLICIEEGQKDENFLVNDPFLFFPMKMQNEEKYTEELIRTYLLPRVK